MSARAESGAGGWPFKDEWLICQSGNDLLTTFERFDKCRGVSIGLREIPLLNF